MCVCVCVCVCVRACVRALVWRGAGERINLKNFSEGTSLHFPPHVGWPHHLTFNFLQVWLLKVKLDKASYATFLQPSTETDFVYVHFR